MTTNLRRETTPAPADTPMRLVGRKQMPKDQLDSLAFSIRIAVQSALGDRQALENNLNSWNNIYESLPYTDESYTPWEGASNIHMPYAATQMDAFVAYVAATAFASPRFYLVRGLTQDAQNNAHLAEDFYNADFMRYRRNTPTWFEQHLKWLQFSARDGMGTMRVLWKKTKELQRIVTWADRYNQETGMPILDDKGQPVKDKTVSTIEVDGYNDADLTPVGLRNIITIPASVTSLAEAAAVIHVIYPYEDELMELVRAGILDREEVDAALDYAPAGTSELTSSQQPTQAYTAGDQISLGEAQGTQVSPFFKKRGPLEVYLCFTNQYDLDGDEQVEENVVWVHSRSWRALGFMRFEYWDQVRPFIDFSPFPRLENVNGFGVPERLGAIDFEVSRIWNQRNNAVDIRTVPPLLRRPGADIEDDDMAWGLNRVWDANKDDISVLQLQDIPVASFEQEQGVAGYGEKFMGFSNSMLGAQMSSHHTAAEIKNTAAATATRNNIIVMRYRMASREVINYIHRLNQQYKTSGDLSLDQRAAKLQIPPEILTQDFQIDVSGASDPMDENTRRSENLAFGEILMKFPFVANDPVKLWYVARMMAEGFNRADLEQMIGNLDEVKQQQQQAQLQQAVAQMAQQQQSGQGQKPGQGGGSAPPPGPANGQVMHAGA